MAEADAAHPWDGQNARAQHEHDRSAPQWPDRHGRKAPQGDPDRPEHGGHTARTRPGSDGEHLLQRRLGTEGRAQRFYDEQVLDHLNERMREFVQRQEMFFLATADSRGECDSSFRAGPAGFLQVIGERTLVYPEYRGNGVHASLGNIQENPNLGIMLVDFTRARIGLHINGRATIVEDEAMRAAHPHLPEDPVPGRRAQLWVQVEVEEAYIHCAKHIPQLQKAPKRTAREWGTDDYKRKGGDFFGTARDARERASAGAEAEAPSEKGTAADAVTAAGTGHAVTTDQAVAAAGPEHAAAAEPVVPPAPALPPASSEVFGATGGFVGADARFGYEGVPGYEQSEVYREAPGTPASSAPVAQANQDVWPSPGMSPVPQMPSIALGHGASGGAAGPSADPLWTSSAPSPSYGTAADGASGAMAARDAVSSGTYDGGTGHSDWRQEAERALAEAQRRGSVSERGAFQGWFG